VFAPSDYTFELPPELIAQAPAAERDASRLLHLHTDGSVTDHRFPAIAPLRAKAEAKGSGDFSPLWSGQNASGCREVPAAEVVRELAAGV